MARQRIHHGQGSPREAKTAVAGSVLGFLVLPSVPLLFGGSYGCVGQCSAPYLLNVNFRPGASLVTAWSVFQKCGHNSIVTSTGDVEETGGGTGLGHSDRTDLAEAVQGHLWTKYFLRNSKAQPLLSCLESSPSVQFSGWPV